MKNLYNFLKQFNDLANNGFVTIRYISSPSKFDRIEMRVDFVGGNGRSYGCIEVLETDETNILAYTNVLDFVRRHK